MMLKRLALVGLAMIIPLGIANAGSYKFSQKFNSQKVCLTNAGWCSKYSTRPIDPGGCECGRSLIGRVTVKATISHLVPNLDWRPQLPA
jgi:hypothetical protein